jgi:hypothetical protein
MDGQRRYRLSRGALLAYGRNDSAASGMASIGPSWQGATRRHTIVVVESRNISARAKDCSKKISPLLVGAIVRTVE